MNTIFLKQKIGELMRRFNPKWFKEYGSWLEYSIEKDAAYCLCYAPNPKGPKHEKYIAKTPVDFSLSKIK